ncbi:KRAB-A domain-containing protein 2-like [Oopsacas minuta]|uniref:KRAB-A domain-containing protein 2-like n=1 Tax=Oopsacas minuta TaxID=111878 RepID=A0AAV7K5T7_9METZ|nr:KRAB-A domain-containing protein 2-like [Oopsacas minuta]
MLALPGNNSQAEQITTSYWRKSEKLLTRRKTKLGRNLPVDYNEILQCGDVEKLIRKLKAHTDTQLYYSTIEDSYDVLRRAHTATGHGEQDRMLKELSKKYVNMTYKAVEFYQSHCEECQKKRTRPLTKGVVVNPILTKASRG